MRRYLFLVVFVGLQFSAQAQEPRVYSQFFMNPFVYNPAYAGVDGHTVVYAMYRQQWLNLDNGPTLAHVNAHLPLSGGLGVGVYAFNDTQGGFISESGIKFSGSYLANFDRKHWLRFGMSLGLGSNQLDTDELDNPFDPAFTTLVDNNLFMLGDFGVTFHSGHFNFGVSIPNLFSYDVVTSEDFSSIRIKPLDNVFGKLNYSVGFLDDDFVWEPHLLYRYSKQNADQFEVASVIHVLHHIWFGASWRQDAGLNGLFGIKVKEALAIGYAFELGDSKIRSFTGTSHELHIGLHLGSKKDHAEHVSSFIKRHRKSAEDRQAEAESRQLARMDALKGNDDSPDPEQNSLLVPSNNNQEEPAEEEPNEVSPQPTDQQNLTPVNEAPQRRIAADGTPEVGTKYIRENPDGTTDEVIKWEPEATASPVTSPTPDVTSPVQTPTTTQPATTVKRGNHMLELPEGNHVIVGAFSQFDHAENYSDDLFQRGYHDVKVGFVTERGYYYVVVFQAGNIATARSRRDALRQNEEFGDAWVLTVE
ncbi:MAG: PorP/SprF family type IX secretion system membrane protein [Cyclobacteriaceae bacterium]